MKKNVCIVTCYHNPDYIRAVTLRRSLEKLENVELSVVKNSHRGLLRYPQVLWKLFKLKWSEKPDLIILTFRGQEILLPVLAIAGRTPVWFDEFIVPGAYARLEKHKKSPAMRLKHFLARVSEPLYNMWLKRCSLIIADTKAHAELSSQMAKIDLRNYVALPVSTDEKMFKPLKPRKKATPFQVFYYSTGMQPLHGIDVVLDAALLLKDKPVQFLLVGGKQPMEDAVTRVKEQGANIVYKSWIPFSEMPKTMLSSGLNIGGPFGGTPQAKHVITGKTYQSLATGVATLIGASETTEEFFIDKKNAIVVPQKDPKALAEAIEWALNNPVELEKIGENGRKLYEKAFSIDTVSSQLKPYVEAL